MFLLAYRSVSRELHATMEGAAKIQSAYLSRVERGLDDGNVPSRAGLEATARMMISWETYRYRHDTFDIPLLEGRLDCLAHDAFVITDQQPAVAASCCFSLDEVQNGDDVVRVNLNVFPVDSTNTAVVFSYSARDADKARIVLSRVIDSSGLTQKYELSKLLLERTENFALSPAAVKDWSKVKMETVTSAFSRTLFENGIGDNVEYMLF